MVPHAHPLHMKWFIHFCMCSILMCKQLWMGMEPQPLHNGIVCSPAVTQAFSRLSKSGSTRAMVKCCRWFHMPIHCIWISSYILYVLQIGSTLMCRQFWMGMEPHSLPNGMVCSPAVTQQAFSRLSKSGTTRAMITSCQWFHMPIHCI